MKVPLALLLVAAPLLAGCVQEPALAPAAAPEGADGVVVAAWSGKDLHGPGRTPRSLVGLAACLGAGDCQEPPAECRPENCEETSFTLAQGGRLAVALRWPSDHSVWFLLRVVDASGKVVASGRATTVDHLGAAAIVEDAPPGEYKAVVILGEGRASTYEAVARLLPARPSGAAPLLPDLVTLQPTDLRIETPREAQVGPFPLVPNAPARPVMEARGGKGCNLDEASAGAVRCLRFSNGVGNSGEGPLDIRLDLKDGATSAAGGRFVQRVWRTDGTFEDRPAGVAEMHALHAHWHNSAANAFGIHAHDETTGARGEVLKEGRKTGICFADVGVHHMREGALELPAFRGVECFNPARDKGWTMGLTPGWYDLYPWILSDQFVDITGMPDGTYELCSTANPEGTLIEADASNNTGCTVFRLKGDAVDVLSPEPYHKEPR